MTMLATRVRSARTVDLPGVAAVLQDAFSEKMRTIIGKRPEKVRRLLEAAYTGPIRRGYDGILVAEQAGRIIGTVLIEPMYYTPEENRAFEHFAVRELGLPRALWAAFLLWLLSHHPEPGEAYISDVGVAQDCQNEGVGQFLMEHAELWAWEHDRRRMTLWVAETNNRAIHVYEKAGYTITRTRSNLLTRLTFGIQRWHFMEKSLDDARSDVF
jgi:ribosomal protein S18 acetylase RimI-like enzyme